MIGRPLRRTEMVQLKRASALARNKFAASGRVNRRRKPVTLRDFSTPKEQTGRPSP